AGVEREAQEQGDKEWDGCRERERREDADAAAEAAHDRDLHRSGEARQDRQGDRERCQAAFESPCQRLKGFPSVSLQAANQPWVGTGCLSSAVPPSSRTLAIDASLAGVS